MEQTLWKLYPEGVDLLFPSKVYERTFLLGTSGTFHNIIKMWLSLAAFYVLSVHKFGPI